MLSYAWGQLNKSLKCKNEKGRKRVQMKGE